MLAGDLIFRKANSEEVRSECPTLGTAFEFEQIESTAACLIPAENQTRRSGARYEVAFGVSDVAFDQTNRAAALYYLTCRAQLVFPDGTQEIYFQLERCERFAVLQSRSKRDPHRGIGNIAENSAVQCAHRVCVRVAGFEFNGSFTVACSSNMKPDEASNRWLGQLASDDFF